MTHCVFNPSQSSRAFANHVKALQVRSKAQNADYDEMLVFHGMQRVIKNKG